MWWRSIASLACVVFLLAGSSRSCGGGGGGGNANRPQKNSNNGGNGNGNSNGNSGNNLFGILGSVFGGGAQQQQQQTPPHFSDTTNNNENAKPADFTCECGRREIETRIVGGSETSVSEFPWQAGLLLKTAETEQPFCGGALVAAGWVLTAAHCTASAAAHHIVVRLGEHDHTGFFQHEPEIFDSDVDKAFDHPDFELSKKTVAFDFSLLRLTDRVEFHKFDHIRPVCFPLGPPEEGMPAIISGWGTTAYKGDPSNVLRKADISVLPDNECRNYKTKFQTWRAQFCAGVPEGGKDACQGDSGGPLIHWRGQGKDARFEILGVTSFGFQCAREGFPGIFADVFEVKSWIMSTMGEDGPECLDNAAAKKDDDAVVFGTR